MTFVVIIITFVVRTKAKAKAKENAIVKIRTKGGNRVFQMNNSILFGKTLKDFLFIFLPKITLFFILFIFTN